MTETIHYISDFTYFSERKTKGKFDNVLQALRAHIKYITRKAEGIITDNLDLKDWLDKAKREIAKRWDSRVALKFTMALPQDVNEQNAERYIELVKNFISTRLNVDPNEIGIALHLHTGYSGEYNPHIHALVFPKTRNNRKLRLNRKELSEFHREWQNLLEALGYRIKKDPEDERLPHLGERIHYDAEAQELYRLRLEIKKLKENINNIQYEIEREIESVKKSQERAVAREGKEEGKKKGEGFGDKQKRALELHFKRLGYKEDDKLAVVLINHREGKTLQKVMQVKEILEDKTLKYLRAMNSKGYSVYASINTLKPSATRRRKEDFEPKQKRIYLDLDSKELPPKELIAKLFKYLRDNGLPQPTHIVKSSKGNYQVYWVLNESVDWQVLERIMEKMNNDLGLDHTQDVSRVFRLPYFRNKKPGKDDLVLNINSLKVKDSDELLKATGKPVNIEPFGKLINIESLEAEEETELPKPQPSLSLPSQGSSLAPVIQSQNDKRFEAKPFLKVFIRDGYNPETVSYWDLGLDYFDKLLFSDSLDAEKLDVLADLRRLFDLAFERNGKKTMSEMDMGFVGLVFSRFKGKVPEEYLETLEKVLVDLARLRNKRQTVSQALDYARTTIKKAKIYWERLHRKTLSALIEKINQTGEVEYLAKRFLMSKYSFENAYYLASFKALNLILDLSEFYGEEIKGVDPDIFKDIKDLIFEHYDLCIEAFKKVKQKTPKDVDLMIAKLGIEKGYDVKRLTELIEILAFIREKNPLLDLEDYAKSIISKAYNEKRLEDVKRKSEDPYNDNDIDDDDFGLGL